MTATVTIEERGLGKPYAVLILRSGQPIARTLWGRYDTWTEASHAAGAAQAYLAADPERQAEIRERLADLQEAQTSFQPLYLLPSQAGAAYAQRLIRKEDYGRTWAFSALKVGEPVDVAAYMKKAGIE